jgi:predicted enzyme related to lactoylglutathione lyase
MEVKRVKINVNGKNYVKYIYNGKEYNNLIILIRENFNTQGEFYEKVFGISKEDAELAGWMPCVREFNVRGSFGEFIKDKGKIEKKVVEEMISLKQAVEDEFFSKD